MPYCRNCGQNVAAEARICPNCNYPQDQPLPASAPAAPIQPGPPAQPMQPVSVSGPGEPQQFPGATMVARRTDGQAVAALILGILGLVFCPIIPSIVAIVLGKKSMTRIEQSQGTLDGHGMAKAGFILGIVGLVFGIAMIALVVVAASGALFSGFGEGF